MSDIKTLTENKKHQVAKVLMRIKNTINLHRETTGIEIDIANDNTIKVWTNSRTEGQNLAEVSVNPSANMINYNPDLRKILNVFESSLLELELGKISFHGKSSFGFIDNATNEEILFAI